MARRALAFALATAALVVGASNCADGEPPGYLRALGPTTTTEPDAATTSTTSAATPAVDGVGTPTTTTPAVTTSVTDLAIGDCVSGEPFAGDPGGEATDARVTACTAPHDGEVVGVVTYNDGPGAAYPGQDRVATHAQTQCAAAFGDYVGVAYGTSPLSMLSLWPTEDSWAGGDRQAICVAYRESGSLTATVRATPAGDTP